MQTFGMWVNASTPPNETCFFILRSFIENNAMTGRHLRYPNQNNIQYISNTDSKQDKENDIELQYIVYTY